MSKKIRVCFLADRHDLYDDRIYWKMAVRLQKQRFEVFYLLVGDRNEKGVTNEQIAFQMFKLKSYSKNRVLNFVLKRINPNNNYRKLYEAAAEIRADIYHFHDLWINRIAPDLKKLPHHPVVFYDAREPYAEDFVSHANESILPKSLVKAFAFYVEKWEKSQAVHYDMVIANENNVRQKFSNVLGPSKTATLYNYSDLVPDSVIPYEQKSYDLIYCGGISKIRGAFDMVHAILRVKTKKPDITAVFVGPFYPSELKEELMSLLRAHDLQENIELVDQVSHQAVGKFYENSRVGLVLLKKLRTFELSMPIKIFEYMTFGLPIIGSNFGHIQDFLLKDQSGIVVDPTDRDALAKAILKLLVDRKLYNEISNRCSSISQKKYNWNIEFERLLGFYNKALNAR